MKIRGRANRVRLSIPLPRWMLLAIGSVLFIAVSFSGIGSAAPGIPILYNDDGGATQLAFNNVRMNDTTPIFRASATDTGNFNRFQLELNTAANFAGTAYVESFSGTFVSGTQYNLQTTSTLNLPTTDGATYYVRARASNDAGSSWGSWSTATWTYTYKSAATAADWYQTTDEQFDTGTLTGTETSGLDSVQIAGAGASIPGTAFARYRASSLALANNAPVATWNDEGSGANNLSQSTAASRPLYKTTSFNGHAAVEFDGINDFMQTVAYSAALTQPNTIVVLGEFITTPGGASLAYLWDGQSGANRNAAIVDNAFGAGHPWRIFAGSAVTGNPGPTAGTDVVMMVIYNGASSDIFVNNVDSFAGGDPGANSLGGFTLGSRFDGSATADPSNLRVVETLIYNRALNGTERSALQDYFEERYSGSATAGTIKSSPVNYDSFTAADSWGEFDWDETETNGSIATRLYYTNGATCDTLVPDAALAGNAAGFTAGPIDISGLDPNTYSELCLQATFTNFGGSPFLDNWNITWLSANDSPDAPTTLSQTKTDNTPLAVGAWTNENTVKFSAQATDQDNPDTLQLCIEAQPLGTPFTNTETTCGTGVAHVNSAVTVNAQLSNLAEDVQYHWQARTKDTAGTYSTWVSFGGNLESDRDFGIDVLPPPPSPSGGGGSSSGGSGGAATGSSSSSAASSDTNEAVVAPPVDVPSSSESEEEAQDTIELIQEPKDEKGQEQDEPSFMSRWGVPALVGMSVIVVGGLIIAAFKHWLGPGRYDDQ